MSLTGSCSRPDQAAANALPAGAVAALIIAACLAWLGGVGWQLSQPEASDIRILRAGLALGGLSAVLGAAMALLSGRPRSGVPGHLRSRLPAVLILLGGTGLMAWASTGLSAQQRIAQRLPHALEAVDLAVTGIVADLPQVGPNGLRFVFEPESASRAGLAVRLPPRLVLGWYVARDGDANLSPAQRSLRAGQRWRFSVRLRRPHGQLNPHGYDYELHLFERNLGATGYVREAAQSPELLGVDAGYRVARLRQAVRDAIQAHVSDSRSAGVLAALAIGDQSAIDRDDWQLFRDTGIAHLVAISGLHITMFSWMASGLIGAAWRRSPRAALWLATPHASRWGGLAAAAAYAVFAGWGVPAQRTLTMLALVVVLNSLGRRWPWPMILLCAAALVTALDPWALLQPGFWLSFVAVGLLLATEAARLAPAATGAALASGWLAGVLRRTAGSLWQLVRSQWAISLGLAPLSMIFFQQVSLVGLLANLLAIPLVTLLITPLALLGIAMPWLWLPAVWLLEALSASLAWLAAWPLAVWSVPAAPVWAQLAAMLASLLVVLPVPWRLRLLALPLALPLLMPPRDLPEHGRFEAIAVDVGQGTAVLVRTRAHLLLFDTGPQYSRDSDAGQRVLLPLLRGRGENRVDLLILSHRDSDHVGGAASLIRAMPVGELLGSLEDDHALLSMGVKSRRCVAGQRWQWDGVEFEILHPLADDYAGQRKPNALSCVLRVAGAAPGGGSLLITGDIERQQELELLGRELPGLRSTVLIVPHHGSKTSSISQLIDAVSPQFAVFQSGYMNRFGHPAPEVVDRYRSRGIRVVESARCGAWSWQGDAAARQTVCERDRSRRQWHDVMASAGPTAN